MIKSERGRRGGKGMRRRIMIALLALPLLQTTCVDQLQTGVTDGIFITLNAHLVDAARTALGLPSQSSP